jgi:hypothetical protein
VENVVTNLGCPLSIMKILGFAKILGELAILFAGSRTLKEWAYARFTFNMIGADRVARLSPPRLAPSCPPIYSRARPIVPGTGLLLTREERQRIESALEPPQRYDGRLAGEWSS